MILSDLKSQTHFSNLNKPGHPRSIHSAPTTQRIPVLTLSRELFATSTLQPIVCSMYGKQAAFTWQHTTCSIHRCEFQPFSAFTVGGQRSPCSTHSCGFQSFAAFTVGRQHSPCSIHLAAYSLQHTPAAFQVFAAFTVGRQHSLGNIHFDCLQRPHSIQSDPITQRVRNFRY